MADFDAKIRHVRDVLGLSRRALSELLEVPEGKIQKIETGDQRADHEFLSNFGKKTGADVNWLLDDDGQIVSKFYPGTFHDHSEITAKAASGEIVIDTPSETQALDFVPITRFSVEASAGPGALVDEETQTGFYAFNRRWLDRRQLDPGSLAVIAVHGDSMEPKLSDGDLILVDRAQRQIADGIAYVLRIDTDLLVKNVQRVRPGVIALLSANALYPPREIDAEGLDGEVEIIGRVVASMHEW